MDTENTNPAPARPTARSRRPIVVVLAVVALAAGTAAVAMASGDDGDGVDAGAADGATSTATVEVRDMVESDEYTATLGFGDARPVYADRDGVVTAVAAVGDTLTSGQTLFRVDDEPTVLVAGAVPAYRALDTDSSDGADIAQLEAALAALGYGDGLTVDETFDADTADAVEAWETDLGRDDPDGAVELGDVVFAATDVRVATVTAAVGDRVASGTEVLTATASTKVATLELSPSESDRLEPGMPVGLELPDGTATTGTVVEIGTETESTSEAGPGGASVIVPVTIGLDDPALADGFDSGSVAVTIERSREDDALVVPVTALLALAEGGYAVEVVDGAGSTHLVSVDPGLFVDGYVTITGDIEAGTTVVVPE